MYRIEIDPEHDLIRATFTGFFTAAEVGQFAIDQQDAVRRLPRISGGYIVLIDTRGCQLHTQDVVAEFARLAHYAPHRARRIAVVANGALYRMQTRRILAADHGPIIDRTAIFATVEEAERWLFSSNLSRDAA